MEGLQKLRLRGIFVHAALIVISFFCLFFFYILIINASRSHVDLQRGFSVLPGKYFLVNFNHAVNDGARSQTI